MILNSLMSHENTLLFGENELSGNTNVLISGYCLLNNYNGN